VARLHTLVRKPRRSRYHGRSRQGAPGTSQGSLALTIARHISLIGIRRVGHG
jgi:hypothetical protein